MSDLSNKILKMIDDNMTINEIGEALNLSNKQLYSILTMLKNKGIKLNRKYYENGDIRYKKYKLLENITYPKEKTLITNIDSKELNALVISDVHVASIYERIDLLDSLYNYCIKEDIHLIFNCGDLLDGTFGREKKYDSSMEQIDSFLKRYPFDKNILNITLLGDHDFSILVNDGIDFEEVLTSYRHDFLTLGYHQGQLNIKNDYLVLKHISTNSLYKKEQEKNYINEKGQTLILEGHHHFMAIKEYNNITKVFVPSISSIPNVKFLNTPSVLKMNLNFSINGMISYVSLEQLLPDFNYEKVSDICLNLEKGKNTYLDMVQNVENINRPKIEKKEYCKRR